MIADVVLSFRVAVVLWGLPGDSRGWPVIVIGLASILAAIAYTGGPFPLGYNGLGDIFVFIFFGLVAVVVRTYVQAFQITWLAFGARCRWAFS